MLNALLCPNLATNKNKVSYIGLKHVEIGCEISHVPKSTIGTSRELNGPSVGCLILLRVHWADHAIYYGVAAFRVQMVPHLSSCASTERHVSLYVSTVFMHIFLSSVYI